MGFSTNEQTLNNINLDSINQYRDFMSQIKPILLQESGYEEIAGTKALGFGDGRELYYTMKDLGGVSGTSNGKVKAQTVADSMGVSLPEFEQLRTLAKDWYSSRTTAARTPEQLTEKAAKEKAINDKIAGFQIGTKSLQKTATRLAQEKELQEVQKQQLELSKAQAERQRKALAGEIGPSDILTKGINDDFGAFKEAQARAGNVILGDDPFTAVGKGTAAIENLARFKDNAKAAMQREVQSIIQGETPLFYQGLGISGANTMRSPYSPDYGGLSSMSLAGQQPFQFNRQMDYNWAALNSSKSRSGKSGLLGGLAGAGIGGLLGGPMGASVGFNIGQGTGQAFF